MASIRQLAACLGLPANFTLVRDFFGYASAPPWTNQTNVPQSLSVLKQARLVRQPHFNLNLVRVGTNDQNVLPQAIFEKEVDAAVQLARNVYAEIGVGIGKVDRWFYVSSGTEYDVIDDDCEADELIDAYDVPDDGIKVFFVTAWPPASSGGSGTVGRTDGDGDGCVVLLQSNFVATGRALAHELGHMYGFDHENSDPNNLMCQGGTARSGLGIAQSQMIPATTGFYQWQADGVRRTMTPPPTFTNDPC